MSELPPPSIQLIFNVIVHVAAWLLYAMDVVLVTCEWAYDLLC